MSTVPPRSRARTCPGRHREPCPGHRQRPGLRAACRREVIGDRNRSLISRRALHASRRLRYADRHLAREGSGGLLNAVRAGPARPRPRAPVRYLAAHLRLTLQGDEVRHATLPVAVRLDDGAEVASLDLAAAYPVAVAPLGDAERAAAARTLQAAFRRAGPEVLGMALEAIARRARRDLLPHGRLLCEPGRRDGAGGRPPPLAGGADAPGGQAPAPPPGARGAARAAARPARRAAR